jgi:hypothetical protein
MGIVNLDVLGDNPGKWMIHCHNACHLDTGMMRCLNCAWDRPTARGIGRSCVSLRTLTLLHPRYPWRLYILLTDNNR